VKKVKGDMEWMEKPWLKHYDKGVLPKIDYPDGPLYFFLDEAVRRYPQRVCTVFNDHGITYQQMGELVNDLAAGLIRVGLQKGQRVGLVLPNCPQYVLVYYAILKAGGIVVAMNPHYRLRELEFQAVDAEVDWLVGLDSARELLHEVQTRIRARGLILTSLQESSEMAAWHFQGKTNSFHNSAEMNMKDLVRIGIGLGLNEVVDADDRAILQYTGGTTGTPKGAIGLHRNLVANTVQFRYWLVGLQEGQEVELLTIPLYHVYGMVVGMSVGIALGATLVLVPDSRNVQEILRCIQAYRVSYYPGVPTLYAMINQTPDVMAGRVDLRSIKACISGSAPLYQEIRERFETLTGAQLMEGYGLSEAPTATHCNPMYGEKRSGSIGLPLPDVDCQVVSLEDGRSALKPGEVGELTLRGPQVMAGYYNRPEESQQAMLDGWLHTGDIARMDEDGYFYIIDRKKDLIKVGGLQVWPREIEEVIAQLPGISEVAVAGIPDLVRGQVVKAWVVLRSGAELKDEEIRAWCNHQLAHYKAPAEVEFRLELPRTLVGKILRRELVREHVEKRS